MRVGDFRLRLIISSVDSTAVSVFARFPRVVALYLYIRLGNKRYCWPWGRVKFLDELSVAGFFWWEQQTGIWSPANWSLCDERKRANQKNDLKDNFRGLKILQINDRFLGRTMYNIINANVGLFNTFSRQNRWSDLRNLVGIEIDGVLERLETFTGFEENIFKLYCTQVCTLFCSG